MYVRPHVLKGAAYFIFFKSRFGAFHHVRNKGSSKTRKHIHRGSFIKSSICFLSVFSLSPLFFYSIYFLLPFWTSRSKGLAKGQGQFKNQKREKKKQLLTYLRHPPPRHGPL
jgi:hypothetical protein